MWSVRKSVTKSRLPEDRPAFSAAVGALIYVVIAMLYILVSGRIAAALAGSLEQLQRIEAVKGLAFVGVTGGLFFFISLGWWRTRRKQRDLLLQSECRAVASMYSASLAHDLNNLLMSLHGLVDELKEGEPHTERLKEMRESVADAVQRLAPFSKRIASTAKVLQPNERETVEIPVTLAHIADLAKRHPDVRFCRVTVEAAQHVSLYLNRELLEQALLNLIVNAAQAAGQGGTVEVVAKPMSRSVLVEIHDSGPGIPPEKLDAIFVPGFTTKRGGSGLGLLSVQAFAASSLAQISVARSHLGGTAFRLTIPIAQEAPGDAQTPAT